MGEWGGDWKWNGSEMGTMVEPMVRSPTLESIAVRRSVTDVTVVYKVSDTHLAKEI